MTRTKVTRIVRIVFFFWLVVSIALGLTTIVTLLRSPAQRHEYGARSSGAPLAKGDRQTQIFPSRWTFHQSIESYHNPPDWRLSDGRLTLTSTLSTVQRAVARTDLEFQRLAASAVWHAGCSHMIARKTPC